MLIVVTEILRRNDTRESISLENVSKRTFSQLLSTIRLIRFDLHCPYDKIKTVLKQQTILFRHYWRPLHQPFVIVLMRNNNKMTSGFLVTFSFSSLVPNRIFLNL